MKLEGEMLSWRRNPPMAVNMREVYEQETDLQEISFRLCSEIMVKVSTMYLFLHYCWDVTVLSWWLGQQVPLTKTSIFRQPLNKLVSLVENELWNAMFKSIVNILQRGVEMSD